jgi:hypothetical protein
MVAVPPLTAAPVLVEPGLLVELQPAAASAAAATPATAASRNLRPHRLMGAPLATAPARHRPFVV